MGPDGLQNHRVERAKAAEGEREGAEVVEEARACSEGQRGADKVLERSDFVPVEELVGEAGQIQPNGHDQGQEANEFV